MGRSVGVGTPKVGQEGDSSWIPVEVVLPTQACYHPDVTQFLPGPQPGPVAATKSSAQEAAQAPIRPAAAGFAAGRRRRRRGPKNRQEPGPAGGTQRWPRPLMPSVVPSSPLIPACLSPRRPLHSLVPALPRWGAAWRLVPKGPLRICRSVLTPPPQQPSALSPRKEAVPETTPMHAPPTGGLPLRGKLHPILLLAQSQSLVPICTGKQGRPNPILGEGPGRGLAFPTPLARLPVPPAG